LIFRLLPLLLLPERAIITVVTKSSPGAEVGIRPCELADPARWIGTSRIGCVLPGPAPVAQPTIVELVRGNSLQQAPRQAVGDVLASQKAQLLDEEPIDVPISP
jgi:hypothetical protein